VSQLGPPDGSLNVLGLKQSMSS